MKKSQQLSRKTWRLMIKNLIVIVVLVVATVVGVRSWFTITSRADASGISISAEVADNLEIQIVAPGESVDPNNWISGDITLDATNYPFLSTLNLQPITGDGKSFIQPPITQVSAVAKVNTGVAWDTTKIKTKANTEYVSFDVYFRIKSAGQKVFLTENTYYGPLNSSETYGSAVAGWSSNSVIGACRMSVIDSSNNQELLWVPAPHLYYDGMNLITNASYPNSHGLNYIDAGGNTISLNTDGTYNHGYYDSQKTRHVINYGTNETTSVTANQNKDYKLHKDVDIANLTDTSVSGYYMNHVRLNLWIEGEDPESRATQVGGEFKVVLCFKQGAAS